MKVLRNIFLLLMLIVPSYIHAAAVSGVDWRLVNPTPQGNHLVAVAWNGTKFVAVGDAGTVLTSLDGVTWTLGNAFSPPQPGTTLLDVAWGANRFVVGGFGVILSSLDGITWTSRFTDPRLDFGSVVWMGTQFVAVADFNGDVYTSPDGVTWTYKATIGLGVNAVSWNGSQLVAVGGIFMNVIQTSPDGVTWTAQTSNTGNLLYDVTWGGGQYVAVGDAGTIVTSPDGISWTVQASGTTSVLNSVVWDGTQFVAGGTLTSPDGVTWTNHNTPAAGVNSVAWNGTRFVAVGAFGAMFTSSDAITWTLQSKSVTRNTIYDVLDANRQYFAVGGPSTGAGEIISSMDGKNWMTQTSNARGALRSIAWSGTRYVAVGSGDLVTSPDGVTWTRQTATAWRGNAVVWNGSQFVVVDSVGGVWTSVDGISWAAQTSGTNLSLNAIIWDGAQFVAVGGSAIIITSPDGVNWTSRHLGTASQPLYDIAWSGTQFVAVGLSGLNLTSPDAVTWTVQPKFGTVVNGVMWNGAQFIAVGNGVWTSLDGIAWVAQASNKIDILQSVAGNISQVVAVGASGGIITSIADVTPPVITLTGQSAINVVQGAAYNDAGATAQDNVDGDLTANIAIGGTFVDTNTVGSFIITYDVSDAAGNAATQVVRNITVTAASTGGGSTGGGSTGSTPADPYAASGDGGGGGCIAPTVSANNIWMLPMFGMMFIGFGWTRRRRISD